MSEPYTYNLGAYHRTVNTNNPSAQKWFDRGLVWSYAFHHEESARCFEKAIDEDERCAMAYWGVSKLRHNIIVYKAHSPSWHLPSDQTTINLGRCSMKKI
jgi:hypothetical protein